MAKSRRNVSRRKNRKLLKKQKTNRRNFRKMSGGGVNCDQYPKDSPAYECCIGGGDWQGNRCD